MTAKPTSLNQGMRRHVTVVGSKYWMITCDQKTHLVKEVLLTGSQEREVLGVGSIPVAILPSCQNMEIIALQLHNMDIVGK